MLPWDRFFEGLPRWIGLDQEPGFARLRSVRIVDHEIRPQRFPMFGDGGFERLRDGLALRPAPVGKSKRLLEHKHDPGTMQGRMRTRTAVVVFPLLIGQAQGPDMVWVMRLKALRKNTLQHGHRQKRAGHFHEREPVRMMPFRRGRGRHTVVSVSQGVRSYPRAIFAGTRYVTATGNSRGCGSANRAVIAAVSCVISSGIAWTRARKASMLRSNCSRSAGANPGRNAWA